MALKKTPKNGGHKEVSNMAILILWLYCLGFLKLIKRYIHSYFYILRFYINKSLYKFKTDYLYRDGFKQF